MPADRRLWPGVGSVEIIAPGMYVDAAGNLHVDVGEVIRCLGSEDTPENRQVVARAFTDEVRRHVQSDASVEVATQENSHVS